MAEERKVFADSVVPLPPPADPNKSTLYKGMMIAAAAPVQVEQPMTVHFSLAARNEQELEERVSKGEILTPDDLAQNYASDPDTSAKLQEWLTGEGFEIEEVRNGGASIYAKASADLIAKSLQVHMVRVTKDGLSYTAAADAPSLPSSVGAGVQAILGLQPFRRANKHSRLVRLRHDDGGVATAATAQAGPPYTVAAIKRAYGADNLAPTGKGQIIAILIDTFPHDSDLKAFWKHNGIPGGLTRISKIKVANGTLPVPQGEETLDVEWTSGIAPEAEIHVYASGSLAFVDLDRALDRILDDAKMQPGLRQVSISLGLGETFMGGPQGEVAVQHQKFVRLAALGVNVFVSSGDAGSNPDATGHGSNGPLQAEYQSSDPFVVSVGGTSLALKGDGSVGRETGWTGSGGGRSVLFPRPAWQTGPGVPAGTDRLVPDVSAAADPNEGALLVFQGQTTQIGGTSWSAPIWAGFCAILNDARSRAGLGPLPFLPTQLYPLAGTSCFRDIDEGSNGEYVAKAGYDLVTGLGVPNVAALVAKLAPAATS